MKTGHLFRLWFGPWPGRLLAALLAPLFTASAAEPLALHARFREPGNAPAHLAPARERELHWDPARTALIVCDLWDRHWCRGATERVAELAPRVNEFLTAARVRGALVIHAPSDTMAFYADWPQRQRAREALAGRPAFPAEVNRWCALDPGREATLPIDDSDGGCDDDPPCPQPQGKYPWQRQHPAVEIAPEDVISDRGDEIRAVLEQRGIEHVMVLGVHANMCVLGRPFAIRALVRAGKQVVLVRDLTDTMYNSRRRPFVNHFAGTDLVVAHIERYWCPSITSTDLLGGTPFRFAADRRPKVVLLIGEDEYRTAETLPRYAAEELAWRGLEPVVITEDPTRKHHFPGLAAALGKADLLVISTRRRALSPVEMAAVRAHLDAGKPVVGVRTASHAFAPRGEDRDRARAEGLAEWPDFDPQVLGGNYRGHYGVGPPTRLRVAPSAAEHPVLTEVHPERWTGHGSLYRCGPLAADATPLLLGKIPGEPAEPVAWVRRYGPRQARIFYTSLGHMEDFAEPGFRRLLLNGILWALDRPVPPETP